MCSKKSSNFAYYLTFAKRIANFCTFQHFHQILLSTYVEEFDCEHSKISYYIDTISWSTKYKYSIFHDALYLVNVLHWIPWTQTMSAFLAPPR